MFVLASALVLGVSLPARAALSAVVLNVGDFGAQGDGKTDDSAAIVKALAAAKASSQPATVKFPAGTFRYSRNITVDGLKLAGAGASETILEATDPERSAWVLTGSSPAIHDLAIRINRSAGTRITRPAGTGIEVRDARNFEVLNVAVGPVDGAGIVVRRSGGTAEQRARLSNCTVTQTLADGIHITDGCHDIDIVQNHVTKTGDDFIAVVSYRSDLELSRNILISGNTVGIQSLGRGISVVGGADVTIDSNLIGPSWGAGIYIVSEKRYNTFGVRGVTVSGNTLTDVATNRSVGHSAIHLLGRDNPDSVQASLGVEGVLITGNRIQGAGKGGIYLGSYCSGVSLVGNELTDVAGSGIIVAPKTADISIGTSNTKSPPNIIHSCGEYGIVVDPTGGRGVLRICGVRFESINRKGISHVDAINIGPDGTFAAIYVTDNWLEQPSGLFVERLVESKTTLTEATRNSSGPKPRAPSSLHLSVEP